jgi:riboflavin kinase / FMN adenylyltransferase
VWVGANFLFGHGRSGNFSLLRTLGQRYGFRAEKIDPVRYKDFVVSSTRIRRLVAEGRVDEAGALLGHPYYIDGTWWRAAAAGARSGSRPPTSRRPTSCCRRTASTRPRWRRRRRAGGADQHRPRPTFGEHTVTIETHVLGYSGDLYGRTVRLTFVQRLRDERRFDDVDALKAQIEADQRRAERLFSRISV